MTDKSPTADYTTPSTPAEQLEKENSLRASIASIKAELDKGLVVTRERQTGKTLALLEWIHENDPGNVIVVCLNHITKDLTRSRYRRMYPQDAQPTVVSIQSVSNHDVQGTNRRWVTDEVWPEAVTYRADSYRAAPYLGGVGTRQCMDMTR